MTWIESGVVVCLFYQLFFVFFYFYNKSINIKKINILRNISFDFMMPVYCLAEMCAEVSVLTI